jgi:hypothetical protein
MSKTAPTGKKQHCSPLATLQTQCPRDVHGILSQKVLSGVVYASAICLCFILSDVALFDQDILS